MKWTSRDTAYLSIIAMLVFLLSTLIFQATPTKRALDTVRSTTLSDDDQSTEKLEAVSTGASRVDGYIVKDVPVTQRQPVLVATPPVAIDEFMTPEEAAAAIGIRVDQLPPRLAERLRGENLEKK